MIALISYILYFRYAGVEKLANDDLNKSFPQLSKAATTTITAAGREEVAVSILELKLDMAQALRVLIANLNPNNSQDKEDIELINDQQDKL
jgi:hypothetical protein